MSHDVTLLRNNEEVFQGTSTGRLAQNQSKLPAVGMKILKF